MLFFLWGRGLAWSKIRGSGPRGPRFKSGRPHFCVDPSPYVYCGVIGGLFFGYFGFLTVFLGCFVWLLVLFWYCSATGLLEWFFGGWCIFGGFLCVVCGWGLWFPVSGGTVFGG